MHAFGVKGICNKPLASDHETRFIVCTWDCLQYANHEQCGKIKPRDEKHIASFTLNKQKEGWTGTR